MSNMQPIKAPSALKYISACLCLIAACCSALISSPVMAHETPIALLTLSERQAGVFNVEWTYSSSTNPFPPVPSFPPQCNYDYPKLSCGEQGLYGELSLQKLGERYSAAVVQIARLNAKTQSYTLTGANPRVILTQSGKLPLSRVMSSYIPLGFEHIMLGIDHLLFVLGLMLLVSNTWMLTKTITSFTIAHSITLAAATLGWVGVPERSVNAAIALSIVFLAVEIVKHRRGQPCLSARLPWAIAFGFGLLHGFGFAGALTDIGLPPDSLPAALLFFNIGVELGQLCFVFIVLALYWCHRTLQVVMPRWSEHVGLYGMGAIASFWFLSRFTAIVTAA